MRGCCPVCWLTLALASVNSGPAPPVTSVVASCYLRGGINVSACCTSGRTCTPFTTSVLDRASGAFTEHAHLNCYPNTGATWGTGDLVATTHKSYTLASCEAACVSNPRCDAITVEQGAGQEFEWIRNIEAGPPGVRHTLNAGV